MQPSTKRRHWLLRVIGESDWVYNVTVIHPHAIAILIADVGVCQYSTRYRQPHVRSLVICAMLSRHIPNEEEIGEISDHLVSRIASSMQDIGRTQCIRNYSCNPYHFRSFFLAVGLSARRVLPAPLTDHAQEQEKRNRIYWYRRRRSSR